MKQNIGYCAASSCAQQTSCCELSSSCRRRLRARRVAVRHAQVLSLSLRKLISSPCDRVIDKDSLLGLRSYGSPSCRRRICLDELVACIDPEVQHVVFPDLGVQCPPVAKPVFSDPSEVQLVVFPDLGVQCPSVEASFLGPV